MAPRKGKVQKEEQVISLGPQVISQTQLYSILYNDKQLFLRNCLLSFGKFEIAMGWAGHNKTENHSYLTQSKHMIF